MVFLPRTSAEFLWVTAQCGCTYFYQEHGPEMNVILVGCPPPGVWGHACTFPVDLLESCPGRLTELNTEGGLTIRGQSSNCLS